jgi:hypothetical protein
MNENTKKILMYSGIGIGVIVAFYAGSVILSKITQKIQENKNGGGGNNNNNGGTPSPSQEQQPTLSFDQANAVANQVYDQIDDANIISGIDETIKLLGAIQNNKDWELVKSAYGIRIKVNPYFFDDYTGDLSGALNNEYGSSQSDMSKLRNFFATKGITNAL